MAYAVLADVNAYFANTSFDATTAISDTEILDWLDQDAAYIDGRLSKIIDLTQLTASGLLVLKKINALLTVCRIDKTLPYFNARTKDEKSKQRNACKDAEDLIKQIEDRNLAVTPEFLESVACNLKNITLPNFGIPEFPKNRVL